MPLNSSQTAERFKDVASLFDIFISEIGDLGKEFVITKEHFSVTSQEDYYGAASVEINIKIALIPPRD